MPRQSHWKEVIEGEARKRIPGLAEVEVLISGNVIPGGLQLWGRCEECTQFLHWDIPLKPSAINQWLGEVRSNFSIHQKSCKPKPLKLPEPPKPTVTRHITFED